MGAYAVGLDEGRAAFEESVRAFLRTVDGLDEYALLSGSRCHGWSRLDVVTHVIAGWQEMLGGLVSVVTDRPSVDAASYWTAFAEQYAGDDPIPSLVAQRRRTAAYSRPSSAVAQLEDVAAMVLRGAESLAEVHLLWQGHVFTAGDFLAIWAVEDVVHQLDLDTEAALPESALAMARATIEALVGERLPGEWDDTEAVLVGTGRRPVPEWVGAIAHRLPVLG